MAIDLSVYLVELLSNPVLAVVSLLCIGVIIVNGATDAPNAIATVVGTRAMRPKTAILMAAACNFAGLVLVSLATTAVAATIYKMVDFGGNSEHALIALAAAMTAIIVWGVAAWWFGIPTSESHSLIAGLTGAAIALQGGFDAVNGAEWVKVIYGIVLSTLLGFGLGWLNFKVVLKVCRDMNRTKTTRFFRGAQIAAGAGVAFMHGAQDGQKFMSIFLLGIMLATGAGYDASSMALPFWLMVLCAVCIGAGTAGGGERIIKNVGADMVRLEAPQGFAASLSAFVCLMLSTFGGIPVSTTHTNGTAILGVGAARNPRSVNWGIALDMVKTWILTFPGCGLMGFVFAKLFLLVF